MFASLISRSLNRFVMLTLASVLGLAARAEAGRLELVSLGCAVSQEPGGDELVLEVTSDTGERQTYRRTGMKKNMIWDLGIQINYHKTVKVRIVEEDTVKEDKWNFRDEVLGTATVGDSSSRPGGIQYSAYTGNGSKYSLSWFVLDTPSSGIQFEVVSLRCTTTQEKDSNGDELRLRIQCDSQSQVTLTRNGVKAGQAVPLTFKAPFFKTVRLQLVENDGFGIHFRDEDLGTRLLSAPLRDGVQTVDFTGHGARYTLTYRLKGAF